jgi:hypothetical protein
VKLAVQNVNHMIIGIVRIVQKHVSDVRRNAES